jgi:hypothetical protein
MRYRRAGGEYIMEEQREISERSRDRWTGWKNIGGTEIIGEGG